MKQLLVVEDDKAIRETLKHLLELKGYSVVTSKNGNDAYKAIIKSPPDLVLCDIDMPAMDGFELLNSINRDFKGLRIPPFIFLTAKVEMEDLQKGLSLGAINYITKPFEYTDLMNKIVVSLHKEDHFRQKQPFDSL